MADTAKDASQESTEEQKPAAPPWGDDFDAERAWNLVQNLRSEKDSLKGELATARQKIQEIEAGESDGLKELRTRAEAAEARAKKAEHELTLSKVLKDFPALEGFEDLLTGDDEEAIRSKAERLAAIGKKPEEGAPKDGAQEEQKGGNDPDGQEPDGEQKPGLPAKPEADLSLTPGHGGEEKVAFDPAAIALAARPASL
ncbi:hypothetical protein ACFVGV_06060 [Pseudarthrobacter scleromae]|uniref:hypothetical protein n=1 Tax=Pseudarthrobacter scleromae TaxID=158897 RepID=UPI00363ABDA4